MTDAPAAAQSFTSWKLDIMDAMSVDAEVTDLDFRVAYRIMQHVNSVSRIGWPSVARLAAQLGKSEDRIMAATKRLQRAGWLVKRRKSQKAPNEYGFRDDRVNAAIDAMLLRIEAIGADFDPADLQGQKQHDPAEMRPVDPADLQGPDPADLQGKHLNQNYLQITPSLKGSECEGESLGPLSVSDDPDEPFPVPESADDLAAMLSELTAGVSPNVVGFFREQLKAGRLTPAMVEQQREFEEQRRLAS